MNNLQCRKAYVRVNLDVDEEGTIIPMLIRWKDGRVFQIEQLKYKCRASSNKVGGGGIRYTVMIRGKESFLFHEGMLIMMIHPFCDTAFQSTTPTVSASFSTVCHTRSGTLPHSRTFFGNAKCLSRRMRLTSTF